MTRWDRLVDSYTDDYRARGISQDIVAVIESRQHK